MFWKPDPAGKVFISYRRSDAQWVAARLNDSLDAYFGEGRVFRDIDSIAAGAAFGDVIHDTLAGADAVIVLIGQEWLTCSDESGAARLQDEDDWVRKEIEAALASEVPVFPVLIEGTPMPRTSELPESLHGLAALNAVSLSDARWEADVQRLARVVALEVPSQAEQRLRWVNLLICTGLLASVAFTTSLVAWNLAWQHETILQAWQAGLGYIVIVGASVLLLVFAREIAPERRTYARWAGIVGLAGTLTSFAWLVLITDSNKENYMGFGVSTITTVAMLGLMSLSGFKPR